MHVLRKIIPPGIIICAMMLGAGAATASCSGSQNSFQLDWAQPYAAWIEGDLANTMTVPDRLSQVDIDVDITFAGATNQAYNSNFPQVSNLVLGAGGGSRSLVWMQDMANTSEAVTITLAFSEPVNNLEFSVLDVDSLNAEGEGFFLKP